MKTKVVTLKGWANNSNLLFSENSQSTNFDANMNKYISENLQGYKRLKFWDTLRGKKATQKVVIKGRYWRGSWADPTVETVAVFYK